MSLPTGTVTFLFTDIEGSTKLWEQHPDAMKGSLVRHDTLAAEIIAQHEGMLVKSRGEGDSLFAIFARATDAAAAACALQQAFHAEPWPEQTPLRVRMALHTGEADLREGDYYGASVNRCARLRAVAHGGQILLSEATGALVRDTLPEGAGLLDAGRQRLRDLTRPEQVYQLLHPALPSDFPPLRSLDALPNNLPVQITSFIGRDREIAEVKRALETTHLLTLTGSGGCGKTRLSLQVAADLLEEYSDGVWLAELAPLADPALVPQALASMLGMREEAGRPLAQTLADFLKSRHLLLVLDNCEHLLSACAGLADTLLRACPNLRILASSREGLGIAGEMTYRIPYLSLPPAGTHGRAPLQFETLTQYDAVRLFIERAVFSQPGFQVTNDNAPAIAQICHRLDGIPLAIELAAVRVKVMPVEQIASRLDDMFRLLTGGSRTALPRQQTLRALIDWGYNLLSEEERTLLRRLSVFMGGWAMEAAEAVCAGDPIEDWEVLDLLSQLVEKSMVAYEDHRGQARYRLLETVRQYGRDRLLESGEGSVVRSRHRDHFLALAEEAEPKLRGGEQKEWMDRLEMENDNLRSALEWCLSDLNGVSPGLRLAWALGWFWYVRSYVSEGRRWLEEVLARGDGQARSLERAKALTGMGDLAWSQGELGIARSRFEESLAIFKGLGDKGGIARSIYNLGYVAYAQGEFEEARSLYEESLGIFRELGDRGGIARSLLSLGHVAEAQEKYEAEQALSQESLAIFREIGDEWGIGWSLQILGYASYAQGGYERAHSLMEESLAVFRGLGDKKGIANTLDRLGAVAYAQGNFPLARSLSAESLVVCRETGENWVILYALENLAGAAMMQREPERAARLFGAAEALREILGISMFPSERTRYEPKVAATQAALSRERLEAAWQEGRAMSLEQAIAYALKEVSW